MILEEAVETIVESLKQDKRVQAIFLKGSMGRREHDEFSDIDLYCLVNERDLEAFLPQRLTHLKAYQKLLFHDEIFIVAPQILAVYENLLHIDLFTVTEENYIEKDFMHVLYDPHQQLEKYQESQSLRIDHEEFQDAVDDVAWFLFQYKKSAARGNTLWSIHLLHHVMTHLAKLLLHRYCANRAQLGLKTFEVSLPKEIVQEMSKIYECMTPQLHRQAHELICNLLQRETEWTFANVPYPERIRPLWDCMVYKKRYIK